MRRKLDEVDRKDDRKRGDKEKRLSHSEIAFGRVRRRMWESDWLGARTVKVTRVEGKSRSHVCSLHAREL